jgi:hypothetical protein
MMTTTVTMRCDIDAGSRRTRFLRIIERISAASSARISAVAEVPGVL